MRTIVDQTVVLDLTRIGAFVDVAVPVDRAVAAAVDNEYWGAGVVEIRRLVGGISIAYAVAKTLAVGTKVQDSINTEDAEGVRLIVTTPGDGFGRIVIQGKENH